MRSFLLLVIVSLALAGCPASATFRSVVASDFKGPLAKLYVFADIGGKDNVGPAEFALRLEELTRKCAVPTMVEAQQELSLDPDAAIRRLVDAGADRVLLVKLKGGTLTNNTVTESVYELRLLDLDSERTMWSAIASLDAGVTRGTSLANGLVLQLSNDGVLPKLCAKALEEPAPTTPRPRRQAEAPARPACPTARCSS